MGFRFVVLVLLAAALLGCKTSPQLTDHHPRTPVSNPADDSTDKHVADAGDEQDDVDRTERRQRGKDGRAGRRGLSLIPPPAPGGIFLEERWNEGFLSIKNYFQRKRDEEQEDGVQNWYAAAYPDLQYLVSSFQLMTPEGKESEAEFFSEAVPGSFGEVQYVLHPITILRVERIRIGLDVMATGDQPLCEIVMLGTSERVLDRVSISDPDWVPGQEGAWGRLEIEVSRPVPGLPMGSDYDTFQVRFRDVDTRNLSVRGVRP